MRLRENADSVAQYQGEAVENARLTQRLDAALENFWALVKKQKLIMGYSTFYLRSATVIPMFIMAPQFFAGMFPLGRLTQVSAAFGEVHAAIAYLVEVFPELSEWKSVIDRLIGFQERLDTVEVQSQVVAGQQTESLQINDLDMAASFGYGWDDMWDAMQGIFLAGYELVIWMYLLCLGVGLAVWLNAHSKYTEVIPTRFNRQRREVCFMPRGAEVPLFVPWESLSAWVVQAQGATQYGVTRQYGMGTGFHHEGELVRVEFMCGGMQLAIAHWEAVRAYMEYEVHDLKSIQDPMDLQGPDDPPHEGMHTFRNARARLHRRIREKEVGWVYAFFWYLYHVMTCWTLPNRLVEWEVKRIARVGRKKLPEAMQAWSVSIPEDQWATPSEELIRLGQRVKALKQRRPLRAITDIFAEVYRSEQEVQNAPERKSKRSRK